MAKPTTQRVDDLPADWEVRRLARKLRDHLSELQERYHVESIALFGSYVRNEQGPESDLDVLVTFGSPLSLFEQIHLHDDLTEWLGVPVDIAVRERLLPRIDRYILREALEL